MRNLMLAATFLATLTACDWNTKEDYHPKDEFEKFLKTQEAAAEKAKAEAPAGEAAKPAEAAPADAKAHEGK